MTRIYRVIAILVLIFSLTGNQIENAHGQIVIIPVDPSDKKQEVQKFLEAHPELIPKFYDLIYLLDWLEGFYIDKKSGEELVNLAMKGMVSGLDPYSNLLIDKEARDAAESLRVEDKYTGVGMGIIKQGRDCVITSVFKNSPALKAGLEPGDIILKVNNQDVSNLNSLGVQNLVRGEEGTEVSIEIRSKRFQKPRIFRLTRANIVYISVDTDDLGKYGYVKISQFVDETPDRVKKALNQFQDKKGLIIDLRDNPGGSLDSVNKIAGLFIGSDKITITMKGRDQQLIKELRTNVQKEKYPSKVVVLVNNFSASASEILAGTLQYYGVAKIVGVRTFGKAVGQSVWDMATDDSGNVRLLLSLTTFKYFLPDGRSISNTGVEPDIEIEQTNNFRIYEYGTKKDRQLQEAIKFLKKK